MRKRYVIVISLGAVLILGFLLFNQNKSATTDAKSSSSLKAAPKIELTGSDNKLYTLPEYEKEACRSVLLGFMVPRLQCRSSGIG